MTNILKNSKIVLIIIISLQLLFLCYYMDKKNDFFVDELYSYTLANSTEGEIFIANGGIDTLSNNYMNRWLDGTFFRNYLTVDKNSTFNYGNIYKSLKYEIHPPLYYYLLHTICSFFPNKFSKWFGFCLNLLFLVFIDILIFLIVKKINLSEKWALFACVLYGFSGAAINNCLLIRSYTMLALTFLLLLYAFLKAIESNKFELKNLLFIFITIIFGSFTHYHFFVFAFFMTVVSIIIMLKNKNYRMFAGISLASLLGVITTFLCFPLSYKGLFNSSRSAETFGAAERLFPSVSGISYLIEMFTGIPLERCIYVAYFFILIFLITSLIFIKKNFFEKYDGNKLTILLVPTVLFIWFITPTINYAILGAYTIRFFFSVTPIIAIISTLIAHRLNNKNFILFLIFVTLLSTQGKLYFLFERDEKLNKFKEIAKGNNIISCLTSNEFIQKISYFLQDSNKIYLAREKTYLTFPNRDSNHKNCKNYIIVSSYIPQKYSFPKIMQITFSRVDADIYEIPENEMGIDLKGK